MKHLIWQGEVVAEPDSYLLSNLQEILAADQTPKSAHSLNKGKKGQRTVLQPLLTLSLSYRDFFKSNPWLESSISNLCKPKLVHIRPAPSSAWGFGALLGALHILRALRAEQHPLLMGGSKCPTWVSSPHWGGSNRCGWCSEHLHVCPVQLYGQEKQGHRASGKIHL